MSNMCSNSLKWSCNLSKIQKPSSLKQLWKGTKEMVPREKTENVPVGCHSLMMPKSKCWLKIIQITQHGDTPHISWALSDVEFRQGLFPIEEIKRQQLMKSIWNWPAGKENQKRICHFLSEQCRTSPLFADLMGIDTAWLRCSTIPALLT